MEARYKITSYANGISKDQYYPSKKFEFTQYDSKTGIIDFELYKDIGVPQDGVAYCTFDSIRPDGDKKKFGDDCFVRTDNLITLTMPVSGVYVPGKHTGIVRLYGSNYERLSAVEFTYNVKADPFADVPVEDDVNYPIITELIYKIEHMPANEDIRQANEATRQSQEASRVAAENSRVSEFNVIKTAYDTASHDNTVIELVNARKGEVDLETKIDKIDASLAEIASNKETALPGQVLTSNGDGTAEFKASGVSDNITSTSTTWSSVKINTEVEKRARQETVDLLQDEVDVLKNKVDNIPTSNPVSNTVLSSTADGSLEQGYWIAGGAKTTDNSSYRTKAPIIASDDKLIAECNTTPVKIQFTYYDSSGALISSDGAWNVGVGGVFYMAKPNGTYSVNVTIIPLSLGNFPANSVINVKSASKLPSDYSVEQGYWLGSPALLSDNSCYRTKGFIFTDISNMVNVKCTTDDIKLQFNYYDKVGAYISYDNAWKTGDANGNFTYTPPANTKAIKITIIPNGGAGYFSQGVGFVISQNISQNTAQNQSNSVKTIIVSSTNPLAKYTSLKTCFDNESEGNKIILVEGIYDCMNLKLEMKKGWTLRGVSPESTKITYHSDGSMPTDGFSHGFFAATDCTIENITIESYDSDVYAVHTDGLNVTSKWDVWIKNCVLRRLNDTLPVFQNNVQSGGQALGIGLGSGQGIHCINCRIEARPQDGLTSGAINLHNWSDNGGHQAATFEFINCDIIGKYGIVFGNLKTNADTIRDNVIIQDCNIPGGILLETEGTNASNVWNFVMSSSYCPEVKSNSNKSLSLPLGNGRQYLKNKGSVAISKGDYVCYVYGLKQTTWHSTQTYNIPIGVEKLNDTNKKYFCGVALTDIAVNDYGYIQTQDIVAVTNLGGGTLFDYLSIDGSGNIIVDNNTAHYIGQIIRNYNESVIKLKSQ